MKYDFFGIIGSLLPVKNLLNLMLAYPIMYYWRQYATTANLSSDDNMLICIAAANEHLKIMRSKLRSNICLVCQGNIK